MSNSRYNFKNGAEEAVSVKDNFLVIARRGWKYVLTQDFVNRLHYKYDNDTTIGQTSNGVDIINYVIVMSFFFAIKFIIN